MNVNSLSTENILFTQKLLQELSENKKLNLSEEQKTAFKNVLTDTLFNSSNIKNLSDIQRQSLLKEPKVSILDLYSENGFLNLLETKLDKDNNLSTVQKQLINSIGLTSDGSISSSTNILIDAIANSTLKQDKVIDKTQVGNNNAVKAKAKSSYQQQIPINILTNMGGMASRIEQIRTNFFA
ncbi:hypothetical protein I6G82_12410 [Lysinibacillus macroides]|uniref:Uncharacterized protein n=1 Tax=Lysinibacillus macroides TaxID=33935 RepID=A0A0M9DL55_9BACI|nr:hypothetical protein [Lysinibacillus macroides]KOY82843.1 hypothetical protein ADM90_05850 [Lysinibacillus macroides]QPR66107.1 hypothetical protein I6G82_12410 [Lysinibacillus macroides]